MKKGILILVTVFIFTFYFAGQVITRVIEEPKLTQDYSDTEKQEMAMEEIINIAVYLTDYITDDANEFPKQVGPYNENSNIFKALTLYVPFDEHLPLKDPWGNDYLLYCGTEANGKYGITGCESDDFVVVSYGADGKQETWRYDPSNPELGIFNILSTDDYKKDLVIWSGSLIRAPKSKDE